ncbi:MAG: hypothetical protein ACLQVL_16805 [Terriglobia bacterium]
MAVVAVASTGAGAEAFAAVMGEVVSAAAMAVIEVVTVAGDTDADGAVGDTVLASG